MTNVFCRYRRKGRMSCLGPEEWGEGVGQKEQQTYKSQKKSIVS